MWCEGIGSEAARIPGFHEVWVPMGGSLLSPAGSPNKALPPQFISPNEKVLYELEAGKVQHSQAARGTGRPSQAQSSPLPLHPRCFPSQSTRAATSCLVDSVGCQFLMPEWESTALKVDFLRAQIKTDIHTRRYRTAAAEADEMGTPSCLGEFL